MPLFNRRAAAEYARKYALQPNPCFPPYSNDCTNFVSQAMLAGGWTMIGGSVFDREEDGVWWYGQSVWSRASYTWAGAHNFSKFIAKSGRGKSCSRSELAVGDVVQISKEQHVFHSMVVSAIGCTMDGDGPLMSYHTTNTQDKFLGKIEASYPSSSGYAFLYWKVADVF
jgi:hypothetical protein